MRSARLRTAGAGSCAAKTAVIASIAHRRTAYAPGGEAGLPLTTAKLNAAHAGVGVLPLQRSATGFDLLGRLDLPNIQKMARPTSRHSMLKPTINSISNVTVSAGVGAIRL